MIFRRRFDNFFKGKGYTRTVLHARGKGYFYEKVGDVSISLGDIFEGEWDIFAIGRGYFS